MKSKSQFIVFSTLLIIIVIISGINLNNTYKNQKTLIETRKSLSNTIAFIDNLYDQQQMMQKMDSVQLSSSGIKAPDFSLQDQNGNITTLKSLGNKKKLLVFSSATCSTCKEFYPELNNFVKNQDDDIVIAVLQIDATTEENKKALEKNNYAFNVLTANDSIFNDYKVVSTPTAILIDHTNTILRTGDLYTYNDILSFIKSYN